MPKSKHGGSHKERAKNRAKRISEGQNRKKKFLAKLQKEWREKQEQLKIEMRKAKTENDESGESAE